ncbi:MAG TPA: nucleotidyltransferase family protein [Thermoanaerobaculia bacterium]|nr:nucleotidyltransferase family protein [Thermoanaerobaculia bacterium]
MNGQSTLEILQEDLRRHLPDLAERFHIRSLGIFGSVARGDDRPDSDLDLLVSFDTTPSLLTFLALERTLGAKSTW